MQTVPSEEGDARLPPALENPLCGGGSTFEPGARGLGVPRCPRKHTHFTGKTLEADGSTFWVGKFVPKLLEQQQIIKQSISARGGKKKVLGKVQQG